GSVGAGAAIPAPVTGGFAFKAISSGFDHTCALTVSGLAYCWGDNGTGELGNPATSGRAANPAPLPVAGGLTFTAISATTHQTCGVAVGGTVYCWGQNPFGNLGIGSFGDMVSQPTPIKSSQAFVGVASAETTCAWTAAGDGYCWGLNTWGTVGDG